MAKRRRINFKHLGILILIIALILFLIYFFGIRKLINYIHDIKEENNIVGIKDLNEKDNYLLTVTDEIELKYEIETIHYPTDKALIYESSNKEVIEVDENGKVTAIGKGEATVKVICNDFSKEASFNVTDMLLPMKYGSSLNKPYLAEGTYTEEENDELELLLETKINEAGYKTRAGVVAACRFLAIEFPYRVDYFYENGNLRQNVDGEGKYYHKGLYLSSSRYKNINSDYIWYGPAYWGESLYSYNEETYNENGLDCSGLITWALFNGGYDPGDLGAGLSKSNDLSLLTIGEKIMLTSENASTLKCGDLVHNEELSGHIGMIIGIDGDTYYVAQSVWYDTTGVIVSKYTKDEFVNHWVNAVLMDNYYEEDGNYSIIW